MALIENQACQDFLLALEGLSDAYQAATVRYLAGRKNQDAPWGLLQAHILLQDVPAPIPSRHFESAHLRAGVVSLNGPQFYPRAILETLLLGSCPTGQEPIAFAERHGGGYDLQTMATEPGLRRDKAAGLRLSGAWVHTIANIYQLGWELLGANPPFESLQELVRAFELGEMQQQNTCVEIWTTPVVHFVGETRFQGAEAKLGVRLADALNPFAVSVAYKTRGNLDDTYSVIEGSNLDWQPLASAQFTTVSFPIPERTELLLSLRYAGAVREFTLLRDETALTNPRRAMYETVDPELANISAVLQSFQTSEHDSDKFEHLITRLFWLAGFDTMHLGHDKRTQRAGDILALTPAGDVLIIECTTTVLKQDKRSQLSRRVSIMKEALASAHLLSTDTIGLLVTSLPAAQIDVDLAKAENDGLAVLSFEDVAALLAESDQPPNATARFARIKQRLAMAALASGYSR